MKLIKVYILSEYATSCSALLLRWRSCAHTRSDDRQQMRTDETSNQVVSQVPLVYFKQRSRVTPLATLRECLIIDDVSQLF